MSFSKSQFISVLGIFAVYFLSMGFTSFETINTVSFILLIISICFVVVWQVLRFWVNKTSNIGDKK
ncbi:hypothetical protein AAEU31_03475 [Pseudoalteromonas sp. SSMSWG5]|uniref:hypothetical protein n=1 Tax=Pseudoalteromonas sp. SSMSWG5 TaxID=3139396 RepID=UPI003BA8462C